MREFPKWLYHRSLDPVLVSSPDEESQLGKDWSETPATFDEDEAADAAKAAAITSKKTKK